MQIFRKSGSVVIVFSLLQSWPLAALGQEDPFDFIDATEELLDIDVEFEDTRQERAQLPLDGVTVESVQELAGVDLSDLTQNQLFVLDAYREGAIEFEAFAATAPVTNREDARPVQDLISIQNKDEIASQLEIAKFRAAEAEDEKSRGLFPDPRFRLSTKFGGNTNPNRRAGGEGDFFGSITADGRLRHDVKDKEKVLQHRYQIDVSASVKEFTENNGTDNSVLSASLTYVRPFNACWSAAGQAGAQFIFADVFQESTVTQYPLTVSITRNVLGAKQPCTNRSAKPILSMTFSARRVLSDPSSANRTRLRLQFARRYSWGEEVKKGTQKWGLSLTPRISYIEATNLDNGEERDEFVYDMNFELKRNFKNGVSASLGGTFGFRESTDLEREAGSFESPFGLTLTKTL